MDAGDIAAKLKKLIEKGRVRRVVALLESVTSRRLIRDIDDQFTSTDPVNHAIDNDQEDIACFLVEKGFAVDTLHRYPVHAPNAQPCPGIIRSGASCNEECVSKHGPSRCPRLYDALDNSVAHNLLRLKQLLTEVREGRRQQGESLHNERWYLPTTPMPSKQDYHMQQETTYGEQTTNADDARAILLQSSLDFVDKDKNTLLHSSVNKCPAYIYVFANNGVPVNVQNENGDSALHLAVRQRRADTAEALLRCGADLSVKNKWGETPQDECGKSMAPVLKIYEPGLVYAVTKGNATAVSRLVRNLWCSVTTVIKDNKNALELADSLSRVNADVGVCLRILEENGGNSDLVHSVLSEDTAAVKAILASDKALCINTRCMDKYGDTLLSHAVKSNNYALVHLLLNSGAQADGIRVRRHLTSKRTVPLMHLALRDDCPIELAMLLHSGQSAREHHEKDSNGNTPLLAAVSRDLPTEWLTWLLNVHSGYNLTDRNKDGMTAIEIAAKRGNTEAVDGIHNFICGQVGRLFLYHLPVSFYGERNINVIDENGKRLAELVAESGCTDDHKVLRRYKEIEGRGLQLFDAAKNGDVARVKLLNNANFRDKNGYTALTKAIVHDQFAVAEIMCTQRPVLKVLPDNCNRYPLHYAYALPEDVGTKFVSLLLANHLPDVEKRNDMNGLQPVEYRRHRDTVDVGDMLSEARSFSAYGPEKSGVSG